MQPPCSFDRKTIKKLNFVNGIEISTLDYPRFGQGSGFVSLSFQKKTQTISAKSLGTLAPIYASRKLPNPLAPQTMLYSAKVNNPKNKSEVFPCTYGLPLKMQHCLRGQGGCS